MADKWWTNEAPAGTGEAWWSNTPADSMAGIGYEDVEAPVAPRDGSSPVIPREVAPTVPQDVAPSEPRGLGGLGMANVRPEPRPDDLLPPGNSVWTKPDGTGSVVYNPGEEAGPPASSRSRIDEAAERLASATGGLDSRDQQIADIEARLRRPDLSERERAFREQQLGDLLDGQARLAERSARVEASRTPGKFADETFGQTARRLGQQAAAGVTDIAAGIPEGLAIQSSAGQLGRVQSYGAGIEDRDQQIADVEARLAQPGISDQERAMREQQLVDLRAGQERLGALGQETLTPPQERGGYAFGQRVREFSKEQFGEPPAEDDTFVGMLARGFGSMVGFGVGTALTGVLGGAVAGSAVNRQQVYEEAKAAGATDEDAYAASSLAGLVGLTEVIPIERALRVLPKPLREEVGGKLFERFKRIAQAGGEEALQEAVQGTANNLIAQEYYDPERGTFEDVPQQALIGAILGSGMGAAGQAADAMLTPSDRAAAQPDDMIAEGKRATEEMIASLGKDAPSSVPKGAVDMGVLYPEPEAAPSPEPESLGGLGGAGTARVQPYITQQGSPLVEPAPAVSGPASARVQPYITDETAARPEVPVVPGTANLGGLGAMPRPSPVKDTQSVAPVQEANAEASQAPAPSPVEPVVASPVEAVEPQQGAVADDEVRLSGDALQAVETDAETFQYKSGGDKKGVTGKLAISKWDNDSAGKVLIYEYEDGRRVVVDGHQRMDAAQRLAREGQDVRLTAIVKREADGITPKEARIIGALQNLRQPGNTDQIDAAKVIREAPEAIDAAVSEGSLAPKNISRARELARLSDDGFKMVLNGVVSERDAAIVGRIVEDKAAHANILGLVSRIEPRNVVEAESIVRQAMNAQTTETQTSLFGDEDVAENVYAERAQILSRTMLALGKKRSTFKVLQDRADAIEGTGQNRLDAEANAAALDDATRYRQVLMTEANRKGPISDALTREARAVRAGEKKPAEAARAFETFLETGTGPDDGDAAAPQRADTEAVDVEPADAGSDGLAAGQPVRDVPAGDVGGREIAGDGREPVDAAGEAGGGVLPDDGQDGSGPRVDDATLSRAVREGLVEKEFKGRGGKGRFRKAGVVLDVDEAAAKSVDPYATRDPSGTGFFVDLKAVEKRIGKDAIEALRYQDAKIGSAGRYAILQKIGQDRQGIPFSELTDDEQIAVMRSYRAPGRGEFSVYGTGADRKVSLTTRGVEELRNGPPRVDVPENSSAQQEQPTAATDTQSPAADGVRVEPHSDGKSSIVRGLPQDQWERLYEANGNRRPVWNEKEQGFVIARRNADSVRDAVAAMRGEQVAAPATPEPAVQKPAAEPDIKPDTGRRKKQANQLRKVAEGAIVRADRDLNQDRNTNTARRARMAGNAIGNATVQKRNAETAMRIADAVESGSPALETVKSIKDIERAEQVLRRAKDKRLEREGVPYDKRADAPLAEEDVDAIEAPYVLARNSIGRDIEEKTKGLRGIDRRALRPIVSGTSDTFMKVTREDQIAALEAALAAIKKRDGKLDFGLDGLAEEIRDYKARRRMEGDDPQAFYREYLANRSGTMVKRDPVKEARQKLIGNKIPGFFETPEDVATRMVQMADVKPGDKVLEPSAGGGRIANALASAAGKDNVTVVERQSALQELLRLQGFEPEASDFTTFDGGPYDAIVMNPPFEKGQDAEHVQRAFEMLKPGGRLVAIMGEGSFFRSDSKAEAFRAWLDENGGTSEKLPENTFRTPDGLRSTGVAARIVTLDKPPAATDTQSPSDPRIFTDNGAAKGNRTRYFRDGPNGGVEWMYAADYAGGDRRWFGFGVLPGMSIEKYQARGMDLAPVQEGNSPAGTDTQSPPAGETEADPLRGDWEAYDAADTEYQAAYERYVPVRDAYRAGEVADADFIAARNTFNAALAKVDAARDAIAGTTDPRLPVEAQPEPAPETPDLFATEPTPAGDQTVIPGTREDQGRDRTRDQMEIEARQKQSKMRRLDQTRVEDDAGGLFGEEQKGLFKEQRPDPAKAEKRAATFTDLRNRLDKMGLKRVALERIDMNAQGAAEIDAAGNARILLGKSLDDVATLGHEALHVLRGMNLFTSDEWNALAGRATAEWMQKYGIAKRYGDLDAEAQVEEAIAEAYGAWLSDRAKNPPPLIQRAFAKMKRFFRAVREALTGQGVTDVNDLFADIESGKVAAQEPQGEVTRKYQRQTQDERNAAVSEDVGEDVESAVTPETPVKARQETLLRAAMRQPLDHAARIPFSLVGGLDSTNRWRPGKTAEAWVRKKLTEDRIANSDLANVPALEAPLGFLDTAAEAARYALIDRYGLPEDYIAADRQRSLKEAAIARELGDHMQAMAEAGVNAESARVLQAILNGEQIEDADMAKLAKPIREGIDALGQRAVEAGLISRESYERNKGSYLHRVYLRHEKERMEAGLTGRAERFAQGRRRKIIGDELRGRGMFVDVEWSKLYKTNPTFLKAGRGKPQVGDKIVILDLETPQGEGLDGIGAPTGKTRKRVFWPADEAIPPAYDNYTNRGTFEVRGEGKDKITLWRDYTKDERKQMGEILDARYTVARTYSLLMHDITTGEFFKEVAQNEQWARNDPPEGARTVEDATKRLRRHFVGRDADQEWVKVPTISVGKDSTAKRYGALSGMYVRADIWRDMVETEAMQTPAWWKSLNTVWKLNKTARNPVVHMNNVMSNAILMDMADVRPRELRMAIKEWRNKGDLYREAQHNGAFGADMVSQEVRRDVMEPLMREIVAQERADKGGWEAYITTLAGIDNALGRMSGKGLDRVGDAWNWFDGKMVQAYQSEDELFRLATYIRRREQGVEPEMAALEARDQFLNYDIKAPLVNAARATVLPFLAYTYRAVPVILRTLAERPWKIAKYATVMAGANALAYSLAPSDYDEEEERGSMQDAQSGKTWLGVPRMLRMPALLGGDPVFMDIRRWIPAGDVFDVAQGENILPAWLHIGGPLVVAMEAYFNRSLFTGEDIRNTMTDSVGEQMFDTANYLYQAFAPGAVWWPGSYHFQNVFFKSGGEAVTASGDPIRRSEAVAGAFGLKVRSRDVEQGYRNHVYAHEEKDRDLARQMAAVKRQASRNQITREQMDAQLAALQAKRRANMERLRERMDARQ